jgi:hypothetical protein
MLGRSTAPSLRALALAGAVLAGVVIALSLSEKEQPPGAKATYPGTLDVSPPAPRPGARRSNPPGAHRTTARGALRVARHFLNAFLLFERHPRDARARAVIAATAEKDLRAWLFNDPPRPVHRVRLPMGHLVALRAGDDIARRSSPLLATVRRGHQRTQLAIVLERKDARWQVARFGG